MKINTGATVDIYLTVEQIRALAKLAESGVKGGIQITSDASDKTDALLVSVNAQRDENQHAVILPNGQAFGWSF